ncbi:MAG: O-antigen ligase family protein [Candidatus Pacebacteria bacterium]|nr:O-antigen ligase family protein [Candidatus Paceibacterota bacterium]
MIETIARRAVFFGAFAVLLIPFFVTESMYFPFITGKNFAFRILVEIMLVAWAVLAIMVPSYRPKRSPVLIAMAAFVIVIGIADAFGINPMRSFWSNFERMEGFITLLHLAAYLLALASVVKTKKIWDMLLTGSVLVGVALSLYSFSEIAPQFEGQLVRIDATFGNPTYFAVYLLFNVFLALVLLYRNYANKILVGAYTIAIIVQMVALYYTGTRGTLLGFLAGLSLSALIMLVWGKAHPRLRRVAGISIAILALAGGLFILLRNIPIIQESPILARVANISLTDTTVESRLTLWGSIGWEGFKERPLLGWGQDNFIVVFGKYYDPIMYKQEPWFDRAHNVFVDWLIAGGALGLLAYLFLFGAGVYVLWKTALPLPEKALLTGLFAAYFVHNIFVFDNLVSYIYFGMLLAYIHSSHVYDESLQAPQVKTHTLRPEIVISAGVVSALALVYFLNIPYIARSQTLIDALTLDYRGTDVANVLMTYEAALFPRTGVGSEEVKEQLIQSAIKTYATAPDAPETKTLVARAEEEARASVASDPLNTRPRYFLAHLLVYSGREAEGIEVLREALVINPGRQNFLYEIGQAYLKLGDVDQSIAAYKEAYDAEPENDTAFANHAGMLIGSGKKAEGEALLVERFGTTTVDNPFVLRAYQREDNYEKIIAILQLRIDQVQGEARATAYISLGGNYLQLGKREEAIAAFEQAILLNPSFKEQGLQIIEAIKAGKNIVIQ